jgi:hypothetical protein
VTNIDVSSRVISPRSLKAPRVRLRYRVIARHYSELAYREERADKARIAERLARLKEKRAASAERKGLRAREASFVLVAAK